MGVRQRYSERPSPDIIASRKDRVFPEINATEALYRELYVPYKERIEAPALNNWLEKAQDYQRKLDYEDQLEDRNIDEKVALAIKKAATWRAAGLDAIPAAAYRIFPSAKAYLMQYVRSALRGETQVSESDVRARICFIFKSGDTANPANYRPIAV